MAVEGSRSTPTREGFRESYIPAEDDGENAGRAYAEKMQVESAQESPKLNREKRTVVAKEKEIKRANDGANAASTTSALTGTAATVATAALGIAGTTVEIPVAGWVIAAVAAVVAVVCLCIIFVEKNKASRAAGEKDMHLGEAGKAAEQGMDAAQKIEKINKKNLIADDRLKRDGLEADIASQEEYMRTMEPDSKQYQRAKKDLDRMSLTKAKYVERIDAYEKEAAPDPGPAAEGTQGAAVGAPPTGADPALAMDPNTAAEGVDGTGTGVSDVASNPSGTTTVPASGTSTTTTTTVAAPAG